MHKKLLAVAVAGALAAPAVAMAQSAVTISGALNLWYESAAATGATNSASATVGTLSTYDVKARDRISDGNGSNIRFTAVEDIGGGLQAFGQVESAVLANAGTRNDGVGAAGTSITNGSSQSANGWATRNSGVGLRGTAWGEVLLGIWDIHYQESYAVDNQLVKGGSHASSLGLLNSFGTAGIAGVANVAGGTNSLGGTSIGGRFSNVIRYQSPNWGGFNFRAVMARPTDGAVPVVNGSVTDGSKNRTWNIVPTYSNGPIYAAWSYFKDKDIVAGASQAYVAGATNLGPVVGSGAVGLATNSNLYTITSNRIHGAYTFPFGLKLGLIYDMSKLEIKSSSGIGSSELKRNVWALPISWSTGPHTIFATYAVASKLKGSIGAAGGVSNDLSAINITPAGATASQSMGDNTGAKFYSLGYQFDLSKRTTLHVNYSQIKNDNLAGYDFFSNSVSMAASNFGADPKIYSVGLRHAF